MRSGVPMRLISAPVGTSEKVGHIGWQARSYGVTLKTRTCVASRQGVVSRAGMGGGVVERPTLPGLTPNKEQQRKRPPIFKVLLHNDDYNKREYVVQVLLKVVEGYTVEDALNVMQEAHIHGMAVVIECSQEKAEETCEGIRNSGLLCTIEPR
ncbi:ATP-dependent Clp protease adapter protein CLPS1 [Picochlorum sp. SENEW3]|nr:ATP-dependent Clp protease adapter protein CLPS1 [Picochlorum sp. SENEW3]